jgi:hypothetical protein
LFNKQKTSHHVLLFWTIIISAVLLASVFVGNVESQLESDTLIVSAVEGGGKLLRDNGTTFSESIIFAFNATNVNPDFDLFECTIDRQEWDFCESPIKFNNLESNKTHTFKVRVLTHVINSTGISWIPEDTPASFSWNICPPLPNPCVFKFDRVRKL